MLDPLLPELNKSLCTGCWFVSAVATADAIISVSCASVEGMFRVGSVTVLATTLNVVGAIEEEEDTAPELFFPLPSDKQRYYLDLAKSRASNAYISCLSCASKITTIRVL